MGVDWVQLVHRPVLVHVTRASEWQLTVLFPLLIVLIIVDTGSLVLPWQCNEQLSESKELCEPLPNHAGRPCGVELYSQTKVSKLLAKPF